MRLRRITKHVKDQNWFAVALDFFIVVVGILIAFQITNWNDARDARESEQVLISRIKTDFDIIAATFDETLDSFPNYLTATRNMVASARGEIELPEDQLKSSAFWSQSLGRPPLRSTTYEQLVASGDFTLISDRVLRDALVGYHQSVDQHSFLYEHTLNHLVSMPDYMDISMQLMDVDVEISYPLSKEELDGISVDREAIKASEGAFETLLTLQLNLQLAALQQDALIGEVQLALEGGSK